MTARKSTRAKGKASRSRSRSAGSGQENHSASVTGEIIVWIALAFCVLLLVSMFGLAGRAGRALSSFFFGIFGVLAWAAPFYLFFLAGFLVANQGNHRSCRKAVSFLLLLFFLGGFVQLVTVPFSIEAPLSSYYTNAAATHKTGGFFGGLLVRLFCPLFGKIGTGIILIALIAICFVLITERTLLRSLDRRTQAWAAKSREAHRERREEQREEQRTEQPRQTEAENTRRRFSFPGRFSDTTLQKSASEPLQEVTIAHSTLPDMPEEPVQEEIPAEQAVPEMRKEQQKPKKQVTKEDSSRALHDVAEEISDREAQEQQEEKKPYVFPPLSLMKRGSRDRQAMSDAQLKATAAKLENTLASFGVEATVTNISCGPTVTLYELHPGPGVKVSKISSLADDIKLNLAVSSIRIEAPIPNKEAVGIEVPNVRNSPIMLRDLLDSEAFRSNPSKISFALGMDVVGNIVVADIEKMPHLLIGGATGSGKSVCINTLIMSILYRARPDEVKFIMIDPKMIELNLYNGIPHLYIPVVTDPRKAAGALQWAVAEMTKRYRLFSELGVRSLEGYNRKVEEMPPQEDLEEGAEPYRKMPQIVIVVDEFADLMMVASKEVEQAVCRLAQLARAAGIHLVLATQRPSVDVITGLIKANMPSRIALTVSSGVDSRTIIDMVGAEKLLGKGDMLYCPVGAPKPVRVQGAFVSEKEVEAVVSWIIEKNGDASYDEKIAEEVTSNANTCGKGSAAASPAAETDGQDEYFADAGRLIIEKNRASIGMLQRNFRIGFNRAARIMDALAEAGVVSEEDGTRARNILMNATEFEQYLQENQS